MKELYLYIILSIASSITGYILGVIKPFLSDMLIDWRLDRKERKQKIKEFRKVNNTMPELIAEMKKDLENPENQFRREFWIINKRNERSIKAGSIFYFFEEHEKLDEKIKFLEYNGYINDLLIDTSFTKTTGSKMYRMTEDFVKHVLNKY
ncbi:MAG: hypothetical protein HOC71_00110 [Candidatus Latescibacteria bacterium]|jgi:hypothetical protein|nr:hypothetical protein [Candidatus Latescibacterota bacterium]